MTRLLILWFFLCSPAFATTYYVDCNANGDAGAGTGTGAAVAWKTINKVNTSSFSAGDSILFNKGCTWRETLTIPSSGSTGNVITFGAYGTGANPIITGSDLKSSGWSQTNTTTTKYVYLTSGTTTTVPSDWNSASNSIETIGGGGAGHDGNSSAGAGAGGGGGAYSKATNVTLTASATVGIAIGAGGATTGATGGDTYICNANSNCASIAGTAVVSGAHGGTGGQSSSDGGAGGSTTGGIGTTKYAGGNAGSGLHGASGGGGAAGPLGAGGASVDSVTGNGPSGGGGNGGGSNGTAGSPGFSGIGGNNNGGIGHGVIEGGAGTNGGGGAGNINTNGTGGAGGAGTEWDATHGSGGGGGGGVGTGNGGAGASYGGGGAGSGGSSSLFGAGGNGLIVLTYTVGGLQANIYQVAATTEPKIVYFNGTRGTLVGSISAIDAEYKWYWASNILYVYTPSGDPSTYYSTSGVEAGARNSAIHTNNKTYITIDGLTLRDGNNINDSNIHAGSATVQGLTIKNSTIERGRGMGIDLMGSSTAADVTIDTCTFQNLGTNSIEPDYVYTTATVKNSTFANNGQYSAIDGIAYSDITPLLENFNIYGNTFSNVTPNGCISVGDNTNHCHSVYSGNAGTGAAMNVYNNVIHGNTDGDGIKIEASANVYNNLVYSNSGSGIEVMSNGSHNIVVSVYYNIMYSNNTIGIQGGCLEESGKNAGTMTINFYNNTCYHNGTGISEVRLQDNITAFNAKNNAFYSNSGIPVYYSVTQSAATINNNVIYGPSGNPVYYNGSTRTWATWQGYGFDTLGLNVDPLFTANGTNFHLQPTSPAINAGVSVGLTSDYAGNPLWTLPDIGAYEYWSNLSAIRMRSKR